MLLILGATTNPGTHVYRDLDDCLKQKEIMMQDKKDAHCIRLQEPGDRILPSNN